MHSRMAGGSGLQLDQQVMQNRMQKSRGAGVLGAKCNKVLSAPASQHGRCNSCGMSQLLDPPCLLAPGRKRTGTSTEPHIAIELRQNSTLVACAETPSRHLAYAPQSNACSPPAALHEPTPHLLFV